MGSLITQYFVCASVFLLFIFHEFWLNYILRNTVTYNNNAVLDTILSLDTYLV